MDRVETLLSETLAERAGHAPTGPVPLVAGPRRLRTTVTMIAASIVIIMVAVLATTLHADGRNQPSTQDSTPPIQQLPAGTRIASFGQVSVRVPAGLPTRTSLCGGPVAEEVVADAGAVSLCPVATTSLAAQPGVVVWFSAAGEYSPYADIAMSPTEVDGYAASSGYATNKTGLGSGVSGVLSFAQQGVTIGVTGPTREGVDSILSTIVVAPVNPFGCAATFKSATTTPAGQPDVLISSDARSAVSCEYRGGASDLLIASYTLDSTDTDHLTTALNALVRDPCQCPHGGTVGTLQYDEVLYFHYPDGSTLRITGRIGANLDTYTNQNRTVANFSSSISQLLVQLTNQR